MMFILTLQGHETGVFSLTNDVGEQVIPIFEEYDDAERYHGMIVDQSDDRDIPLCITCLLYTSPSPRDVEESRMPSSA